MRLSVLVSATIAIIIANASAADAAEPMGWCEWLPWTCKTHRRAAMTTAMVHSFERVECRMRRIRYCCNRDPPVSATSCPGPPATELNRGGEHWASTGGSYLGMECPLNRTTNYRTFLTRLKVNACTTKYPKPDSGHTTVWCPWEYWSTWNYRFATNGLCKRVRNRDRRCACPSRSWIGDETNCLSSRAYTEKQEQSVNCSITTEASPEVTVDAYRTSLIPIVLVCLSFLVGIALIVTIGIICAARCKRKQAAASAAASSISDRPTSFASRLASSFRRGAGITAPSLSTPAYASAAFYNASVPVPTVSLNVSDGREGLQERPPPPPYSSQPELPRGAVGPPPPYS